MKTNFKKTLAVLLAVLMLTSVFSVTAFAAYTAKILAGTADGSTLKATLEDGTPITEDMLSLTTNASNKLTLPSEAYFEREDYIQDGWTKTASGGGTLLKFGATQTVKNNTTKYYPHWKQVTFNFTFNPGNYYDETDPNNFADAEMTQVKELFIKTDGTDAQPVVLPGALYTREGYEQTGWCAAKSNNGTGTKFEFGSVYNKSITKDVTLYPFWTPIEYTVRFEGGEFGVGTVEETEVPYNKAVNAPGEIFTREDYTQIGWARVDGSDVVEVSLSGKTDKILEDTTYYPVWRKNIYYATTQPEKLKFGISCIEYNEVATQTITITNEGNVTLNYTLPVTTSYDIYVVNGTLSVEAGESVTIGVQPVTGLSVGNYSEDLVFVCDRELATITVPTTFKVVEHSFRKHISNGDATYTNDGTKSADCLNGCGKIDTLPDPGSKKVYDAANNTAVGIIPSYEYHRTVRFTAYGSGMDAVESDNLTKRFRPVNWYVNDDFNGEFTGNDFEGTDVDGDGIKENLYDVTFTHTIFGSYTLTINYVEEVYDSATGEWVETDVTDTKTFDYTVGTNEYEEQEIVRPNTILNIIFGLFAQLLALLGIGG